jgi:hypothetical protein
MVEFMLTVRLVFSVLILSALASSCRTTKVPAFEPIPVPAGLSVAQIEVSILAALANSPIPPELSTGADIADRAFSALFVRYNSVRNRQEWFPESRKPGEIIAGMSYKAHYLQAKINYDIEAIRLGISNSRNLNQDEGWIHKNAVHWVEQLDARLRRSLGYMSAYSSEPRPSSIPIENIER